MRRKPASGTSSGALLAILWPLTGFTEDTDNLQQIIAASKAATGGTNWAQVKTWRENGKITLGGLQGTYEAWFDFPNVRTALTFMLGPAKGAQGWNGKESWSTYASDQLRIEISQEAIANAVRFSLSRGSCVLLPRPLPNRIQI